MAQHYPELSPIATGLGCRCPRCGQGALFQGLLTVRARCPVCDLDLSPHDSGDGPAVFVIFILGALVVPLAALVDDLFSPPAWVHLLIWLPTVIGLSILLLRPAKALLIAYHYKNLRHEYDD
jgi:uncharacterized protein (DUF983 family)